MPRFRHCKDLSHDAIVKAFTSAGWQAKNCTQLDRFCDVILLSPQKRVVLAEIKTGNAKLQPHQAALAEVWPIITFRTIDEVARFIRLEEQSR